MFFPVGSQHALLHGTWRSGLTKRGGAPKIPAGRTAARRGLVTAGTVRP